MSLIQFIVFFEKLRLMSGSDTGIHGTVTLLKHFKHYPKLLKTKLSTYTKTEAHTRTHKKVYFEQLKTSIPKHVLPTFDLEAQYPFLSMFSLFLSSFTTTFLVFGYFYVVGCDIHLQKQRPSNSFVPRKPQLSLLYAHLKTCITLDIQSSVTTL